jgi:hypothetical protein
MRAMALAALLLPSLAMAQETAPREQALADKLVAEISANVDARAQIISLQRQLAAALARIKDLEAKKD